MEPSIVNVHDAKTQLSKLLARVEAGEEITIARAGKPVARLVPARRACPSDMFGVLRGQISYPPDFLERDVEIERLFGIS